MVFFLPNQSILFRRDYKLIEDLILRPRSESGQYTGSRKYVEFQVAAIPVDVLLR
jgi:hypothetical protein